MVGMNMGSVMRMHRNQTLWLCKMRNDANDVQGERSDGSCAQLHNRYLLPTMISDRNVPS